MARKNESGEFIISAGEVAAYSVCPEAWRLEYVENNSPIETEYSSNSTAGQELHKQWAKNLDEAQFLIKGIRLIIYLIGLAVLTLVYAMK
jgi:hypothetical protein